MSEATELATEACSADPAIGLRAVVALSRLLERLTALQVEQARAAGWSWEEIASVLGVTRQSAHKRYAGHLRRRRGR